MGAVLKSEATRHLSDDFPLFLLSRVGFFFVVPPSSFSFSFLSRLSLTTSSLFLFYSLIHSTGGEEKEAVDLEIIVKLKELEKLKHLLYQKRERERERRGRGRQGGREEFPHKNHRRSIFSPFSSSFSTSPFPLSLFKTSSSCRKT
jgi:hypothetical protein